MEGLTLWPGPSPDPLADVATAFAMGVPLALLVVIWWFWWRRR